MKAIIIDDEQHCTETLTLLLNANCPEVEVVAVINDPRLAPTSISSLEPDIVFLDIEMPHLDGFDVLKQLNDRNFSLVFTTAYDEFAIKAIKHSALDYLLKPVDRHELIEAVRKAEGKREASAMSDKIDRLFERIDTDESRKIPVPTLQGLELIPLGSVIRCEADNNYTSLHLEGGKSMVVSKPLKEVEAMINSSFFFRPHQSHLVNMKTVQRYVKAQGGYLELNNGDSVPISRSKREEVVEWLRSHA